VSQVELEQPLQEGALREIERSLYGKLKAHRLPDSFIERCGEDAIQKGFLEYLRACEEGAEIENRNAFVVRAAFCRAIDELRREAHEADGAVDSLIDNGRHAAPPSEDLAVERLEAEELREAIASLPTEERQILVLHYFEELSDRRGAELLYCSERTYRRRLKRALAEVSRRLGVPIPEPGSELAIEIGLAGWTTLGGAQVALAHGPLDQLIGVVDRGRDGLESLAARLRDPVARLSTNGTSERASALASGPAGKFIGGCAGAAVVCLLGGVVGPGIGGPASSLLGNPHSPAAKHRAPSRGKVPVPTRPQSFADAQGAVGTAPAPQSSGASRAQRKRIARRSEQRQLAEQASGITRVEKESSTYSAPSDASTATAASESATTAPSGGDSEASAGEEAQAQQQFGAFK
jgi:RNA polymerase sigma-70 factor (ECF subfamily)